MSEAAEAAAPEEEVGLQVTVPHDDVPETPGAGASEGVTPSPASPEAPAESTPAAPAEPDYFGFFREKAGVDFSSKYKTPEELAKGVKNLVELAGRKTDAERRAEQIIAWHHQQQAQQQAAAQVQTPAEPAPLFAEPQLQDGDTDWIEDDPANPGARRIARDTPPDIRKRLLDRHRFVKQIQESPGQLFAPALQRVQQEAVQQAKTEALAEMQAMWQQQQAQWQEQQLREQIVASRRPLMLQMQNGQPVIDAATGMPVVNDYGRAYMEREQWLYGQGIPEHLRDALAHEYATARAAQGLNKADPKRPPGATAAATSTGGQIKPGQRQTAGRSLAQRIMQENPHVKDDDEVTAFEIV